MMEWIFIYPLTPEIIALIQVGHETYKEELDMTSISMSLYPAC